MTTEFLLGVLTGCSLTVLVFAATAAFLLAPYVKAAAEAARRKPNRTQ